MQLQCRAWAELSMLDPVNWEVQKSPSDLHSLQAAEA